MTRLPIGKRFVKAKRKVAQANAEIRQHENLVAQDFDIISLSQTELVQLIEEKSGKGFNALSEVALHVLAAGRCAGSYGCGGHFPLKTDVDC